MSFSLELLTQILAEVGISSSLEEEILTRIKGSTTPQEINEDSTSEESCVSDGEQSFEQEIEEEEQQIGEEEQKLQHDLSERNCAYQSFIEQWFQPHESLDGGGAGIGAGAVVQISFCTSCSYRGMALTMKKMLESAFPGVDVELSNYPPPLPKRVLSKFVPVLQIGSIVLITAGDHIFPRLGYTAPPPWYYSLKQKRFGVIATTWLLGNALQSFLQGTGAFEVMCNGDLVFSKLRENRFPGEYELRELVGSSLGAKY